MPKREYGPRSRQSKRMLWRIWPQKIWPQRMWPQSLRRILRPALALLTAGAGLAACAGEPSRHGGDAVGHSVQVSEHHSAFFQTRGLTSQSLRLQADEDGHQWPVGLTLNAQAVESTVEGWLQRRIQFRHDVLYPGDDLDAVYTLARSRQRELAANCREIPVQVDGEALALPVAQVSVRVFTDRDRMPAPVTDQQADVLELIVDRNPQDRVVMSTRFRIDPDERTFARLAAAGAIRYDLCGPVADASADEITGLRQVFEWRRP